MCASESVNTIFKMGRTTSDRESFGNDYQITVNYVKYCVLELKLFRSNGDRSRSVSSFCVVAALTIRTAAQLLTWNINQGI